MLVLAVLLAASQTGPLQIAVPSGSGAYVATRAIPGAVRDEIVRSGGRVRVIRRDPETGRHTAALVDEDAPPSYAPVQTLDIDGDGRDDILHPDRIYFDDTPAGYVASSFQRHDLPTAFVDRSAVSRVVDIDANGFPDVLLVDPGGAPLQALLASGPRSLGGPTSLATTPIVAAEAFDADGDGDLDLAVVTDTNRLQIWTNDGGPFPWPTAQNVDAGTATLPTGLVAADINGDAALDLVLARGGLRVHLGGANAFAPSITVPGAGVGGALFVVDADLDGDLDVLSHDAPATNSPAPVRWLRRTGPLTFAASADDVLPPAAFYDVTVANLTATAQGLVGTTNTPLLDLGIVHFPLGHPASAVAPLEAGAPSAASIAAADLDGDGDSDLVVARHAQLLVYERVGRGAWREARELLFPNGLNNAPEALQLLRTGDPASGPSVVVVDGVGDLVARHDLLGAATPPATTLTTGLWPGAQTYEALDFDGDGDDDVLLRRLDESGLDLVEQTAPRVFAAPVSILDMPPGTTLELATWGDIDDDGDKDLVAAEYNGSMRYARVYRLGAGGLSASTSTLSPYLPIVGFGELRPGGADVLFAESVIGTGAPHSEITGYKVDASGALVLPVLRASTTDASLARAVEVLPSGPDPNAAPVLHVLTSIGTAFPYSIQSFTPSGPVPVPVQPTNPDASCSRMQAADLDGNGASELVLFGSPNSGIWSLDPQFGTAALTGSRSPYCFSQSTTSSGRAAQLDVFSSSVLVGPQLQLDQLRLEAYDLPPQHTVLFLASQGAGFSPGAGGVLGTLCLGGTIGRFLAPGQLQPSSLFGTAAIDIDPLVIPLGGSSVSAVRGANWNFQAWFRDFDGGAPVSRMTNAVSATL